MNSLLASPDRAISAPEAARELLQGTGRPWAFRSFALGWMKLDVLARLLLVIVLGITPVLMTQSLNQQVEQTEPQLKQQEILALQMIRSPETFLQKDRIEKVAIAWSKVDEVTAKYRNEVEWHRRVEVVALALLGVLAVLLAIGQYRRYIAVKHLKVALDFFRTDEGIAWLQENRDKPGLGRS